MTDALFRINGDSSNQGFDGTNSQTLTFTLKTLPLSGVRTWELQVFDAALFNAEASPAINPPRQSTGAPELTLVGSTSAKRVAPATGPAGSITCQLPASGAHSWIVRSIVNGGKRLAPGGATVDDPALIHERLVAVRDANNARKIVPTETRQYSNDGWTDAVNQILIFAAATDYPGVPVQRYLPGAVNGMRDAFAAALAANPSAQRFTFPAGVYPWASALTVAQGLRNDLMLDGYNTTLLNDLPGNGQMLQWTISTEPMERVRIRGMKFKSEKPASLVAAIFSFGVRDVVLEGVTVEGPTGFASFGGRFATIMNGAHNLELRGVEYIRAQISVCGLGQDCDGVLVNGFRAVDCNDFCFSAVSSAGRTIRNVKLSDFIVDGIAGSGAIFLGGDGNELLAELSGISVDGVKISGNWGAYFANQANAIHLNAAALTEHVSVKNIQARVTAGTGAGAGGYAVRLIAPVGSTAKGVTLENMQIGSLGSVGGVNGFICSWPTDILIVRGIECYGNRGMIIEDARHARVHDNIVRDATDDAFIWRAATRNTSGRIHHNQFHSATIFKVGGRFSGGFNHDLDLDHNEFLSDLGGGASKIDGGTLTARLDHNYFPNDGDVTFKAGVVSSNGDRGLT